VKTRRVYEAKLGTNLQIVHFNVCNDIKRVPVTVTAKYNTDSGPQGHGEASIRRLLN